MVNAISILGATGSIGRQTVAVAEHLGIPVAALTTNKKIDLLEEQARRLRPKLAVAYDEGAARALKTALRDTDIRVASGLDGLMEAAAFEESDCVVTAVSGAVGLRPTLAAIDRKKRIALANKETLVCAGKLVMARVRERGAEIVPVDSEHSAIFQSLMGRNPGELKKILLTGSGGPFLGKAWSELEHVTPEQAVKHPNWSMGAKISVDSATMMNKGLEFIEAMHLFSVTPDQIQVVVHPQSVVHSMVELVDGTVIAQLGVADMGLPIQLALTYPQRCPSMFAHLDFWRMPDLTFGAPDLEKTPCLGLAMDCARAGGTAACVMSAANEVAVGLFLGHKLGYNQIYDCAAGAVESIGSVENPGLEEILDADRAARAYVMEHFA
ncbi:MAG TPA: 1-deoxy-D-xylulose-5-phosphate reductoisomerase [Oscillospiraceae bacterium]|nr:1-deoxy-D-xylulose-5-phosphate reductoisomerase [Oscillospiraceae bacterium]HPS75397.1 1-deoxy-D-xylulose-5-phosphate reductoisomerase [Oscillospiraceae bacterium]